jgi:tetratricopeptide (TPR) repeat protein
VPRTTTGLVGARYQLINELARGGMGAVHRALDRLTGRIVTIKRLGRVPTNGSLGSIGLRTTLAREFRLLSALRHPNVISVLDYGFDDGGEPYVIMDLEENARTIVEAAADAPLALQVDLVVQALRAVAYLHRLGIIHRDLKPDNMLVVREQVKVLDFGLSVSRHVRHPDDGTWAGTPAYMAPEILRGEAPSEQGDLYAIGMVAYELLVGSHPFRRVDDVALYHTAMSTPLPRSSDAIDPRLRPVLEHLLARTPADRYRTAAEVITALETAIDRPLAIETVGTRESVLQTVPLVGRDQELATLEHALREAMRGRGGTWLIGGESGVGKSRVLEELRTRALIEGAVVLAGQAMSQAGGPYHVWRPIVSALALRADPNDFDAEALATIVPNVGDLIGRQVERCETTDAEAAQTRLLVAVEHLFRLQLRPLVVILDDLHWAGSESLRLLAWLAQAAEHIPLLVVGSHRNDEMAQIPDAIHGARTLGLRRLTRDEVGRVGVAMIGEVAERADVLDLLVRETEGIPFFVVEVVRSLAEHAGALDRVGARGLPSRVVSGGMQKVVRRRLARVPSDALAVLRTAAVIGRRIEPDVLSAVHPGLDLESWATACSRCCVLESRDQQWIFAHDKLREQLVDDLSTVSRASLHRSVAEALQRLYPERPERLAALAHHWAQAGDAAQEARFAREAGLFALQSGACREAIAYLQRAQELVRASEPVPSRRRHRTLVLDPNRAMLAGDTELVRSAIEGGLSEAFYRLGDLKRCREHSEAALRHYGQYVPRSARGWALGVGEQSLVRMLQGLLRVRSASPDARRIAGEVARVQLRLTDTFFYSLQLGPILWSTLRVVNQCEPVSPLPELAQGYVVLALLAGTARASRLADAWGARALAIAKDTASERNVAWVQSRLAVHQVAECRWADADLGLCQSTAVADRAGDLRLLEETRVQRALVAFYAGRFEQAAGLFDEALVVSRRSGNRQIESWARMGQGAALSRRGHDAEAARGLESALEVIDQEVMTTEAICLFGTLAAARLRCGDAAGSWEAADRAMWHTRSMKPVAYWLQQSLASTCEALLTLVERQWQPTPGIRVAVSLRAGQAVVAMRRFARHMPLGRPHAALWSGLLAWTRGRQRRAMRLWARAVALAEHLGTPYEQARAHFEIGRHLAADAPDRSRHLYQAEVLFERLGCVADLESVRRHSASA